MRRLPPIIAAALLSGTIAAAADPLPAALGAQMEKLSTSLKADGGGWSEYAGLLHEDYARWVIGESYQQREAFLGDLKEWWDYGMRVASRENEIVSVDVSGNIAIVRMKTSETFAGPDGAASGFEGYVVSVWLSEEGEWKLLSADIAPAPAP